MAKQRTDTESVLKLVINNQQAKTSIKELKDTYFKLNTEITNMRREDNPEKYDELAAAIQKVKAAWDDARKSIAGTTKEVRTLKDDFIDLAKQAVAGLSVAGVFYGITNGVKTAIQKNAELSDSYADVQKTTGLTEESVDRLNEKFKRMDTRTASNDLLDLASVAGKLGYSSEKDVEGFVRAADKIGVALGEDLGGVEESVNSLGKLVNIFKLGDEFELEDALLKVGSAINTLGAEGTAAESNLIDFAQRMAGIAPAANISLPTVLAYGAVMDELGQSMESSSTAIGQFIVGLGSDVPKYAKVAKMSVQDFTKLLKEDANEAFLRVLENSKTAGGGIQALATNMGILEVSGARGIASLGAMADNIDLVRQRMDTAKDSFDEGTSVIDEFNTKNTNLAANLEKIWNKIDQLWQNSGFRQWMTEITAAIADNRSEFEQLNELYNQTKTELKNLENQLNPAIERYDELTKRTVLNTEESEELRRLIVQLSDQWPIAVEQVDSYGNALSINTQILRDNIDQHNAYLRKINEVAIKEGEEERKIKQRHADRLKRELETKRTQEFQGSAGTGGGGGTLVDRALTNDELKQKRDLYKQVTEEIGTINYSLGLMGVKGKEVAQSIKPLYTFASNASAAMTGTKAEVEKAMKDVQSVLSDKNMSMDAFKQADAWMVKLKQRLVDLKKEEGASNNKPVKEKSKKELQDEKRAAEKQKRIEEQNKEHLARLLKEEEYFSVQKAIDQKEKNDREVAQLEFDYKKKIDKYTEFKQREGVLDSEKATADDQIKKLEKERTDSITALKLKQEKEFAEKSIKVRQELSNKMETEHEKERNRINAQYDELKKDAGTNKVQLDQIEVDRAAALTDAKIREEERFAKIKKALEDEQAAYSTNKWQAKINEVNLRYNKEIELLKEKNSQEIQETEAFKEVMNALETNRSRELVEIEKQKRAEIKDVALNAAQSIADATFSIISSNIQAESNAKLSAIQKDRDKELSQRNLTEKQKKTINDKYDKLERAEKLRAWKAQKKADIISATINTALAVTRALPNWILAAAAGIAGAAQIAVIASQKAPQFAKGGLLPQGPSHAQGGINLMNGNQVIGNIEGGEPILSKETYRNNREVVDALLYSSQRLNGRSVRVNPIAIDAERIVRNGGYSPIAQSAQQPIVNQINVPQMDQSEMLDLLRVIAAKENVLKFNNRLYDDQKANNVRIENRANA